MDLISECALRAAKIVWRPGHGGFAFTVVCKATFELQPGVSPLAAVQEPVVEADEHNTQVGGLALASELVPLKKRPEVLVMGHAYAPDGRPVASLLARLVTGEIDKAIQVVGDRYFGPDGRLSEPARFTRMPLTWERAAGGPGTSNPAGRPLGDAAQPDHSGRVAAPNLLPAGLVLTSRRDAVPPAGLGPIAPMWPSRAACLHGHAAWWNPSRWHERPLPADIDLSYFNAAPPDQQRALPFGEAATIYLENLHPRFANLPTRLTPVTPAATVDRGAGPQPLALRCDTLIIDADRGLAMLVWRAHVLLDHPDRPGRVVITGPPAPQAHAQVEQTCDVDVTLGPGAFVPSAAVLPFARAAAGASSSGSLSPGTAATPDLESTVDTTRAAELAAAAPVLPFASQDVSAPRRSGPPTGSMLGLPFMPHAAEPPNDEPPAARRLESPVPPDFGSGWSTPAEPAPAAEETLVPPPADTLALPPLIGPLATVSTGSFDKPHAEHLPTTEARAPDGPAPVAEPEPPIDFDPYPPERCGAIAARLACDASSSSDILRAEDLDAATWQQLHDHWLDRIRAEVARSRKKALSDYDSAYVSTLEAKRGAIALNDYARFAEAAERSDVASALAEGGLPEGAWPHIHRVWIGRMVKDVRLSKQVRAAIDAVRASG